MPVAPHAAVIPGKFYHTSMFIFGTPSILLPLRTCYSIDSHRANVTPAYTEAINLLDYSVVVIPVTKADKVIDLADPDYKPLNDVDAKNWQACR